MRGQYVLALTFVTFLTRSSTVFETPSRTRERGLGKKRKAAIAGSSRPMYPAVPWILFTDFCTDSKLVLNFYTTRKGVSEAGVLHDKMLYVVVMLPLCRRLGALHAPAYLP